VCDSVYQNCEFGVITPCACGTINCDRVNTCESVQSGKVSDTGLVGPAGYAFFLTNGYCQSGFQYNSVGGQSNNCVTPVVVAPVVSILSPGNITYFNNLLLINVTSNQQISSWKYSLNGGANVSFSNPIWTAIPFGVNNLRVYGTNANGTGTASVSFFVNNIPIIPIAPIVTIISPANITYNNNNLTLNVSANQAIDSWKYSLNNGVNLTFTNPITINVPNGSNTLRVYGTNANGTGIASVNFFVNTTSNGNNNQTNQTNSTTLPVITVLSPVNGWIYNITSILLNATANQPIISWTYGLNGAVNLTFVPGTIYSLPLLNGTNSIWIYGTNANGTGIANINFIYNSSFNGTNPSCSASVSCGSWGSCKNGEKIRTCTSISISCVSSIYDESKKCSNVIDNSPCLNDTIFTDVLPLTNSTINLGAKKAQTFNWNLFVYWFVVALLVLLIAILVVYIIRFVY
jgi:hypothetical protein